jgi:hypothetical protein
VHGDAAGRHVGKDDGALAMPHQRGDQAIELAARRQYILAAERADYPLASPTALASLSTG